MTRLSLTVPLLSRWVADTVMEDYRLVNLSWEEQVVPYEDFDFVIVSTAEDGNCQRVALCRGRVLAVFRYMGEENLMDYLDALADMVR